MADDIVWEDPPLRNGRGRTPGVWMRRLAPLREHPGKWANLGQHPRHIASSINGGASGGGQKGEFEATVRCVDQAATAGTLYVRYVGPVTS